MGQNLKNKSDSQGQSNSVYQQRVINDLDPFINNSRVDNNSEIAKAYMSQTQKPGNVANASAASYNEAAQNYMISIVQNVYVGGSMGQTGTQYQTGPAMSRSQNTSKRQMKAPRRLTSDQRQELSVYNEQAPKRQGHSLISKGSFKNSKSKSNIGMSTNQAAINHYMHEIQTTGQEPGGTQKKKRQKKSAQQGQRYFYPIYDQPLYNQPAQTMKKVVKSGSKLVIGQNHPMNKSMQKPLQGFIQYQNESYQEQNQNFQGQNKIERTRTTHSMNRKIPEEFLRNNLDKGFQQQDQGRQKRLPDRDTAQAFSQLSLVSGSLQSPKSQDKADYQDTNFSDRRNNFLKTQNLTPGNQTYSTRQEGSNIRSPLEIQSSIQAKDVKHPLTATKQKASMSRNGTINLRQSQVNFTANNTQKTTSYQKDNLSAKTDQIMQQTQNIIKSEKKISQKGNGDKFYNTHNTQKPSSKQSPLSVSQIAPEKRMFKVRPQAVKYSIDAAAPNKDLDDDIVQHDFQEKSQNLNKNKGLAKTSNFPGKRHQNENNYNHSKKQQESFAELMGGAEERDGGFQFTNEFRERMDVDGVFDEASSSSVDRELSPDGQANIKKSERYKSPSGQNSVGQQLVQSPSSQIRQNFYSNPIVDKSRGVMKTNSGQNSQTSFQAMIGNQMPSSAKESSKKQRTRQITGGQIGDRNPKTFKSPLQLPSRAHRLSAQGINARGSLNGANLIYTSTDSRSFKRIFTGHQGKNTQGVLPKIDPQDVRQRQSQRRLSLQQFLEKEEEKTEKEGQLLSMGSQPRLSDFQESKNEQTQNRSFRPNTQPSIQLGQQQKLKGVQDQQNTVQNPSNDQNPEIIKLSDILQGNSGIRDSKTVLKQHNTQIQGQQVNVGNRMSSRNKHIHQQQQNQLAITQALDNPSNQTQAVNSGSFFVENPQPAHKRQPTMSPREKQNVNAQARSNQNSKIRNITTQNTHMGRKGMAEARFNTQRKAKGISDAELDRKIEQQLLIQQQNKQNRVKISNLTPIKPLSAQNKEPQIDIGLKKSKNQLDQVKDFLASPLVGVQKQQKKLEVNSQEKRSERRGSKDLQASHRITNPNCDPRSNSRAARGAGIRIQSNNSAAKRQSTSQAKDISDSGAKISTRVKEKESGRKVVVKNLIIQNSNLQNCNVYIGGNEDEKEVTIVHKDEDPRENKGNYSELQNLEMSPLETDQKSKDQKSRPKLNDFKITKLIGEGHQGKVVQATHRQTGRIYALKIIPQKLIKEQKQIQHIFNEKQMLTKLRKDFRYFPKIYSTFSDKVAQTSSVPNSAGLGPVSKNIGGQNGGQCLVFQMSLIEGVNLFKFQKHNLCIELSIVKYFAAQALMIVDYLQDQNLIYRDIKPENFMVEFASGNLKLVDFGFAKQLKYEKANGLFQGRGRTFTKCGTPEYMAPEVIQQKELSNNETRVSQSSFLSKQLGYSLECDIWSWGVLLCEMVGGFNPFAGGSVQQTFENILNLNISWPKNISKQCKNLLQSIFVVDPNLRASIQEIKKHAFFHGYQWYDLENSISQESKEDLDRILSEVKEEMDKEDIKDREEREKQTSKKGLSVQTKNLNNQAYLTEVTEEDKRNDPSEPIDSARFSQICQDFDEISAIDILQPKSAGLPFKMKFLSPNVLHETDSRAHVSDYSMRKNMLAFKDF